MKTELRFIGSLVMETGKAWAQHRVPQLGAALAFYTLFAIAPLFIVVLAVAGLWFGEEAARGQLFNQLNALVGPEGGEALQAVIAAAHRPEAGLRATSVGLITVAIGATGVFVQLQNSLNIVWNVRRDPGHALRRLVRLRLMSFAMVVSIGFLLLVSLVVSAAIAALSHTMSRYLPEQEVLWQAVNFLISLLMVAILFALVFKVLPDVELSWKDVWIGAAITAILFNAGKFVLGMYLGRSSIASAYGAAGSLVIVLMWVFYSAQILFFGAEFTRLYAQKSGRGMRPLPGAHFVVLQEIENPAPPRK